MAKKKVRAARLAIDAAGYGAEDDADATMRLLVALRHYCDSAGVTFARCEAEAYRIYMSDIRGADEAPHSAANSPRYSGWDRRHDDNMAEGRPVGNQWDDTNFFYQGGVKMPRRSA